MIGCLLVLATTSGVIVAQDWPSNVQPPKGWRPPPPREPRLYRPKPPSPFPYRGTVYPNYAEFKKSPDFAEYQEENRRAAQRFTRDLLDQEIRRQAAVEFFRYRSHFRASTRFWMDENDRWHALARTAWRDLAAEGYE